MKKVIALIVSLCVLSIAVLGLLSMTDHGNHEFRSCVNRITGFNCPPVTQSLADVAAHITAAQKLGMAIPNPGVAAAALLMALFAIVFLPWMNTGHLPQFSSIRLFNHRASSPPPSRSRLLKWLARLEARDPYAYSWAHAYG